MEALDADSIGEAERQAGLLLSQHRFAYAAHVFHENRRVATIGDTRFSPAGSEMLSARSLLLTSVSPQDRAGLQHHLRRRRLQMGERLVRAGEDLDEVVIPIDAVLANVSGAGADTKLLSATIGRESLSDLPALLADAPVAWDVEVQQAGDAWFLPARVLYRHQERSPHLRQLMLRMSYRLSLQIAENVVCATSHDTGARIARWLLSITERTNQALICIRQDQLARLLGVQRSTVNAVLGDLKRCGALQIGRGSVIVADLAALRRQACACHRRLALMPELGGLL